MQQTREYYMRLALREAAKAAEIDEVPVGAVVIREGKVIARAKIPALMQSFSPFKRPRKSWADGG